MQQVASQNAPSPNIVIPHFIFGGSIWLLVTLVICIFPETLTQHFFNPKLLAITHLLVLGWITMVILGALYQLIPVVMEVKLKSEGLAIITFVLLATGTLLLSLSFWNYWLGSSMYVAATLLLVAMILFGFNVLATSISSPKKSIEKRFIQTSVIWLLITVLAGVTLVINLKYSFLPVAHLDALKMHAHAGIIGWFLQLIIGVSSRLLPMFMVSHGLNAQKLHRSYYFINIGLPIGILFLMMRWHPGMIAGATLVVIGVFWFLSFLVEAYKKRVKKELDIGMKHSAFSFLFLVIPSVIIAVLLYGRNGHLQSLLLPMSLVYGSTLLIGFVSSLIMGQTYKTLPFIVWLKVYRNRVGKGKLPFPKDLYSEKLAKFQYWIFAVGTILLMVGECLQQNLIVRGAGIMLFLAVAIYNSNMLKIVIHRPEK